jgi:hypothetical protein
MNYWITTHWPAREGENVDNVPDIWLPEGRQAPGTDIAPNDLVLIYESKTARTMLRQRPDGSAIRIHGRRGRQGIICIGRIVASLVAEADANLQQKYADNTEIWWRWHAAAEVVSRSGFVPRRELAVILGYKPAYSFRGFGEQHSGLRRLSKDEFQAIVKRFNQASPIDLPERPIPSEVLKRWDRGEESETHRRLKEFVAADPSSAIGEPGLSTLHVEYSFASGDRADIVLADRYNRIVAVEIEPEVNSSDEVGALQAIKYRYMLEWCANRAREDSRAILIAHKIHATIRKKCAKYGVECYEISREKVNN